MLFVFKGGHVKWILGVSILPAVNNSKCNFNMKYQGRFKVQVLEVFCTAP